MKKHPFNMIYPDTENDRIQRMHYYQGFKVQKDREMFEEEIKVAQESYEKIIAEADEDLMCVNSYLVHYMERFCEANKRKDEANAKILSLHYKLTGERKND